MRLEFCCTISVSYQGFCEGISDFWDLLRTEIGQDNAEIITAILGLKNIKYHLERSVLISAEARNRTSCCCPSLTSGLTSCTNAKVKLI